jgi:outer membrane autotransporter protein
MRFSSMIALASASCCKGRAPRRRTLVGTAQTQMQTQTPQPSTNCVPEDPQQPATWGQVFGSWESLASDGNATKLHRDIGGFLVGADTGLAGGWRVGALGGYSHASAETSARNSSSKTDSYHLGAYRRRRTRWSCKPLGGEYSNPALKKHRTAKCRARQEMQGGARQGKARQGKAGQGRQGKAGRAGQGRAGQGRAGRGRHT